MAAMHQFTCLTCYGSDTSVHLSDITFLQLVPVHQSCGGMTGDGRQSYAATVISAAKVSEVEFLDVTHMSSRHQYFVMSRIFLDVMHIS